MWSTCHPKGDNEFAECAQMSRSLSRLMPPAILALLAQESMHGYVIVQRLADTPMFGGIKPDAGGVYRTLKQMEADGHVVSTWKTSGSGPAKHTFELTDSGRACLGRWTDTLRCYRDAINELLGMCRESMGVSPEDPEWTCAGPGADPGQGQDPA